MSLEHLPLSRDTRAAFPAFAGKINNPGLIFDRYIAYWEDWTLEPKKRMEPPNPKLDTLKRIAGIPCDARLLAALSTRQQQLFESCDAKTFEAHPDWRFITGLGGHSPLEVGFTFHRLYGIPLIAGSSLKGLTRAYAKFGLHVPGDELDVVFGTQEGEERAGAAIFFDALPIAPPQLELDVMNPHYPDWYQKKEPPANWQNPIPVFFLTVGRETCFRFAVGGRGRDGDAAKFKAHGWLKEALREMGAGAKTAAGYGYFTESNLAATTPPVTEPTGVAETPKMTAPPHNQPVRRKGERPEQEKAAAEAKKKAEEFLRQVEKEKRAQAQAVRRQTVYRNGVTERKAEVKTAADGSLQVFLPELPEQNFKLIRKSDYSQATPGAKIRVRVVVDKNGVIVRAEEL